MTHDESWRSTLAVYCLNHCQPLSLPRVLPLRGSASITSQIKGLLWLGRTERIDRSIFHEATFKTSSSFRSDHVTMREFKNVEETCGLRPYHIPQYLELVSMPVLIGTLHVNFDRTLCNCCPLKGRTLHTATAVSKLTKENAFQKWPVTVILAAGQSLSRSSTLWRWGSVTASVIHQYIFQYSLRTCDGSYFLQCHCLVSSLCFESTNPMQTQEWLSRF